MKYWLFDGSDIIGPFSPQELVGRRGFSSESLICPDGFTEKSDYWQRACTFTELQPVLNGEVIAAQAPAKETAAPKQDAPVEEDETPTSRGSSLHVPATPAKSGPIEEYFNTIKGEDLGNILGIPDPNENTDADLARVIEKELGDMPETEIYESLRQPFSDVRPTPENKPAPKAAPAPENKQASPKQQAAPAKTQKPAQKPSVKPAAKPVAKGTAQPKKATAAPLTREPDSPEGIRVIDLEERTTLSGTKPAAKKQAPAPQKQGSAQPKADAVKKKTPLSQTITKGEVEIEKFDTGRHQEAELGAYPEQAQEEEVKAEEPPKRASRSQWLMAVLACLLLFVLARLLTEPQTYLAEIVGSAKSVAAEYSMRWGGKTAKLPESGDPAVAQDAPVPVEQPLRSVVPVLALPPKVMPNDEADLRSPYAEPDAEDNTDLSITEGVPLTPAQTALLAVQQYELPNGRGTVKEYLQSYYAPQFAKGYEADWSVALLHKNIYIVQYRLTKTRTEPIVYVFQADGEKGILTGALNNITLDLVGKIQQ